MSEWNYDDEGEFSDTRLRFLARSLPEESFGGDAPLPPLDVEGALGRVLAASRGERSATPSSKATPSSRVTPSSKETLPPERRQPLRWPALAGAAVLLLAVGMPWLMRNRVDEPRTTVWGPSADEDSAPASRVQRANRRRVWS